MFSVFGAVINQLARQVCEWCTYAYKSRLKQIAHQAEIGRENFNKIRRLALLIHDVQCLLKEYCKQYRQPGPADPIKGADHAFRTFAFTRQSADSVLVAVARRMALACIESKATQMMIAFSTPHSRLNGASWPSAAVWPSSSQAATHQRAGAQGFSLLGARSCWCSCRTDGGH